MNDVTGAATHELADASASDLVNQVNEAARHVSLMPLVILLWLPLITIPLAIVVHARDKARRTVVAFYEVDGAPAARFQSLADSFTGVQQCAAHWHVTAEGAVRTTQQYKINSGASTLLHRDRGKTDLTGPPVLATNIAVPSLHARKRSIYFLPDRILIRDGRRYADMSYSSCRITGIPKRFIENGSVPSDSERIGTTWRYVNKGGGPDRRYKNNPQLPIMRYGELTFTAQPGFSFVWQTSRAAAAPTLSTAINAIAGRAQTGQAVTSGQPEQTTLLDEVRSTLAELEQTRKRVQAAIAALTQSQEKLGLVAGRMRQIKRDDLAQEALEKQKSAEIQLAGLKSQFDQLRVEEAKLTATAQNLQRKY